MPIFTELILLPMKRIFWVLTTAIILAGCKEKDSRFAAAFTENFDGPKPEYFSGGSAPRLFFGIPSLTEEGTSVMLERIQPSDPPGPGASGAPEIASNKFTHFGSYSARLRLPDVKAVQPNAGAVTGFFTWINHEDSGLSEIDFEWHIADPSIIYIGAWTTNMETGGDQRVERTLNLSTGEILYTRYYYYTDRNYSGREMSDFDPSDDAAVSPRTIQAIDGYDASKRFYIYGFDWYPDRITWWVKDPNSGEKIILWDYSGTTPGYSGIPQYPSNMRMNFWHTAHWAVETNPNAKEAPKYTYCMETDWMKYEPFVEINSKWLEDNDF